MTPKRIADLTLAIRHDADALFGLRTEVADLAADTLYDDGWLKTAYLVMSEPSASELSPDHAALACNPDHATSYAALTCCIIVTAYLEEAIG